MNKEVTMPKSEYVNPGGESSLTGSKGLTHHEPLSQEQIDRAADHVKSDKRTFSDYGEDDNKGPAGPGDKPGARD